LGRSWEDSANKNAVFTVLLKPDISPMEASQLTLVAGLAIAETIRDMTGLDAKIKWPNDVIAQGKKIVGILTEMSASMESISYVAVGIGINVNTEKFSEELEEKAASIYMLTGKKFERAKIISEFMKKFMPMYNAFCKNGFAEFCEKYNSLCINIGNEVRAEQRGKVIKGRATGVDSDGCIKIETEDGCVKIMCGEVSLRTGENKYI
jgi:BirA family biotin operon repressor/biotin-[acetyl-CoA-carboxylase] ligase